MFVFFYLLPVVLLQVPKVQSSISSIASNKLEEKIGTKVLIGSVEFEMFNKLVLKDLYLEDKRGDTLFSAQRLSVGFDLLPLLKGQLNFSSAQLFTFQLHLHKETPADELNLQFVLDAFASKKDKDDQNNITLNIQTINLRRGQFTYHVQSAPATPKQFNSQHIALQDISAKLRINTLNQDSIHLDCIKLSLKEKAGFDLKRIAFSLQANPKGANIDNLKLWLPKTYVHLSDIRLDLATDPNHKIDWKETGFFADIIESTLAPNDLAAFVPELGCYNQTLSLQSQIAGTLNNFTVSDFVLTNHNDLLIQLVLEYNHSFGNNPAFIASELQKCQLSSRQIEQIVGCFSKKPFALPPYLSGLDELNFKGGLSGYVDALTAHGELNTNVGMLKLNVQVGKKPGEVHFFKGKIASNELDLALLGLDKQSLGKLGFDLEIDALQKSKNEVSGEVVATIEKIDFKDHTYRNIHFSGNFTESSFNGKLDIEDEYGSLDALGYVKLKGDVSEFNFLAHVSNLKLDKLNLSKKHVDSNLSFSFMANAIGNTVDNLFGQVAINHLSFTLPTDSLLLDSIQIKASQSNQNRLLSLQSDIINADVYGNFEYAQLLLALQESFHQLLPAIIPKPNQQAAEKQSFRLLASINNTEKLSKLFNLPITIHETGSLYGQYHSTDNSFLFEAKLPKYTLNNMKMEKTKLSVFSAGTKAELVLNGIRYGKFDVKTNFELKASAKDNKLDNIFTWKNQEKALYAGTLIANTRFSKPDKASPLEVDVVIQPTELVFNDSVWTVHPAHIKIGDKIAIDQLYVQHADQYVKIDGSIAKDTTENLNIQLSKVNLDYIFNSLMIPALELGGVASGSIVANDMYGEKKLYTNLHVTNFSFNQAILGDLQLNGAWDGDKEGIVMKGDIWENDTTHIGVDGIIYPANEALSVYFDAQNANGKFLRKYLHSIATDLTGEFSGKLHLHGNFKNITVSGNTMVHNGGFGIAFLNTYYTFTDSVQLTDNVISIKNLRLHDREGKVALVNGSVQHNHFSDFRFQATLQTDNFLVFNGSEKQNPFFYGLAYGSGNVSMYGTEYDINFDIALRTDEKTKISLNFMEQEDIDEYNFIHFKIPKGDILAYGIDSLGNTDSPAKKAQEEQSETTIKMNLNLEMTPDAQVEFYVDPISGDRIKAWGKGKLRILYGNKTDPKIYGNYTLDRGSYNFSLQQVIFKDFFIQEGSALSFRGDPYSAILDIKALHTLSANLVDLDPSFALETPMSTVAVHCLLNITGELEQPTIKFDIRLPHSTSDLERQVKNVISTEEMMNRQMIFLLALGRFYTQEANISSPNDFASVASSTLSSQLNNLLGSLNENLQIGTNIRTSNYQEYSDTEVKLLLSSQLLNNRLTINGNLGYKDNPVSEQKFIGDFDLEYKLTKSGDIRLKAYNHYNDKYYYLKTTTKQGVGVMFRRDFDNLYDFFNTKQKKELSGAADESEENLNFIQFK